MPDKTQLPYLVDLIDDESEVIQKTIVKKLASYGPCLEDELRNCPAPMDTHKVRIALYLVDDYLKELKTSINANEGAFVGKIPHLFSTGHIVKHKRYGYRAVIVDFDLVCLADEIWYEANIVPPPSRNQPWYYLLVHLVNRVTYAAQSSLELESATERIIHPLLSLFFDSFSKGLYNRNSKPWPRLGQGDPPKG